MIRAFKERLRGTPPVSELTAHGLTVGKNFFRGKHVMIDPDYCWLISIGDDVRLAADVHILAHEADAAHGLGAVRIAPVTIGNGVLIAMKVIIMPGVTIGDRVAVFPGSVVKASIPSNSVAGGNPARRLSDYETYMQEHVGERIEGKRIFGKEWTVSGGITRQMRAEMLQVLEAEETAYVR